MLLKHLKKPVVLCIITFINFNDYKGVDTMNLCKQEIIDKKIEKTIANLKANNMEAYFCRTKEDAKSLAETLIVPGDTIASGGSVSLVETGIIDLVKKSRYNYLDRSREGITPEEIDKVYRDAFSADVYFTSTNAVTENGELYNVDGNGNRVAAIVYGPKSVVVVCGYNKIVRDLKEAEMRVKEIAAPANTIRLNKDTYCSKCGVCVSAKDGESTGLAKGCKSEDRICCSYLVSGYQRQKNRIKVIIVGEELGF